MSLMNAGTPPVTDPNKPLYQPYDPKAYSVAAPGGIKTQADGAQYQGAQGEASTMQSDQREVNQQTETVEGRLDSLLDKDSALMKRAETKAMQRANSRGLMNSSMAVGEAHAAQIDAAMPIATQDAGFMNQQRLANQAAENEARRFNAGNQQQMTLANIDTQNRFGQLQADHSFAGAENDKQRDHAWKTMLAERANEREIKALEQQAGLYAQFTKGVADINASDLTQVEKDNAVRSLWEQFQKGSDIANTLRAISIKPDGTVERSGSLPTSQPGQPAGGAPSTGGTGSTNAGSSTGVGTSRFWGDGGRYRSGYTTNDAGQLVDSKGDTSPKTTAPTNSKTGTSFKLVDGQWRAVTVPKNTYSSWRGGYIYTADPSRPEGYRKTYKEPERIRDGGGGR